MRFYETSYDNGTAPGTATRNGLVNLGSAYSAGASASQAVGLLYRVPKRISSPTITTYDGAGTSGNASSYSAGSWVDANATLTQIASGLNGALFSNNKSAGGSGQTLFAHFVSDASLIGA